MTQKAPYELKELKEKLENFWNFKNIEYWTDKAGFTYLLFEYWDLKIKADYRYSIFIEIKGDKKYNNWHYNYNFVWVSCIDDKDRLIKFIVEKYDTIKSTLDFIE